jgi:hemerythrin-like domain-containing protein
MNSIPQYLTSKHRECDQLFIEAESAVAKSNWQQAELALSTFVKELEIHFNAEENLLFPKFEQATGMTSGPTVVMRGEHKQMRNLIESLQLALSKQLKDDFLGLSETLLILMQQHNMKEEMMLYPMSQQQIPDVDSLVAELQQHCETKVV